MRDIGKNIKDLRIRGKMTQEELAEKLFVTRQTVSNYENGKSRPDVDMIVRIGEIFSADANAVIYGIPAEAEKRGKRRRAIILTVAVLMLGLLMAWLYHITRSYMNETYFSLPFYLVADIGLPCFWILLGWWLLEVLSLVVDFKTWNHAWVRYIRAGVLVVLVIVLIILIINLAFYAIGDYLKLTTDGFSFGFPYIPLLSNLSRFVILLTYRYPILYSFFGVVFRLFGFPKLNKK